MVFEKLFTRLAALPVASIAHDVTSSVLSGIVTTLSSPTGSGKTLYESAYLADSVEEQVVVLVPRRFLAVNAAETVAELAECEVGGPVGYAVGSQAGDLSHWTEKTKLVFATHGYALASGLINTARIFVLDEVHETSMDQSIVRALLHRRMQNGDSIKVLEMSATMDAEQQATYWSTVAKTKVFKTAGTTYPCEFLHRPADPIEDRVVKLINRGRRGILVFRPGVGEIEDTVEALEVALASAGLDSVEVCQIYGEMSYAERQQATAAPAAGTTKVLVGTNVMESGVNIPWADAGVSCGTGKENTVRPESGATYLQLVNLARWRLDQQKGRVNRFGPGVFVLCSPVSYEDRAQASTPEIIRLALTELVMHCASFGLRTSDLTFDYVPDPEKVREAEVRLERLGLVDEDCKLTKAGKGVVNLPVGPETGAMLWHADQTGCLGAMLPLAAVIEVGGLRKDNREPHGFDTTSDYLDGLFAFRAAYQARGSERRDILKEKNISYKRFDAVSDLLHDLERRLDWDANFDIEDKYTKLRRAILAGSLEKIFTPAYFGGKMASIMNRYGQYGIGNASVLYFSCSTWAVGDLRVITPRDQHKSPFTILEKVTSFDLDDLKAVAQVRPEVLIEEHTIGLRDTVNYRLFGEYLVHQATHLSDIDDWGEPEFAPSIFGTDSRSRRWSY